MVSMSSQTNLVPQPSPQKAIRVSVEIPTCDGFGDGHEVTIQVSPKKPSRGSNPADNAPSYSEIQPIVFDTTSSTVDPPAFESAAAATIPPSTTANVSPNTLAITTAIVYDSEEEDVFGMVKGPNSSEVGRKEKRWYLITRGRKVGVFYKFWCVAQVVK